MTVSPLNHETRVIDAEGRDPGLSAVRGFRAGTSTDILNPTGVPQGNGLPARLQTWFLLPPGVIEYVERHPGPEDIGLLVEVAETSLDRDRGWKKRIYAVARIPVYWIVNLVDRQVEVFTNPSGPGEQPDYGACQVFLPGDQVPVVLDRNEVGRIAVHDLLP